MEKRKPHDVKVEAKSLIRHFVIGGYPGDAAIRESGAKDQVEYYQGILEHIMGWSGLGIDELGNVVEMTPDTIENSQSPNFKPLYREAVERIRVKLKGE